MANIDVSELLTDPDFTTDVYLIRRTRTTDEATGKAVVSSVTTQEAMVVEAASAKDLERVPEGLRLHGSINVYFAGELFAESTNGLPDIITFGTKHYQVKVIVEDYMNFGAGWTKALCVLVEFNNDDA